jgi:hypothetical protein
MIFALFGTKFCRGIGVGKMGCSDAYEQDGAINFVRALIPLGTMALSFQLRYPDGLLWFNAHRPDRGVAASFNSGCSLSPRCARTGYHPLLLCVFFFCIRPLVY